MRKMNLGCSGLEVPVVAVGCMRLYELDDAAAENFLQTSLELGANFFDHADIYRDGECEKRFAKAIHMNASVREKIILQSKCGIRKEIKTYDFSKEHILKSVDGILSRLQTDYLDVLLLHRPDALVEPDEVAEAFDLLKSSGKVRNFGVSNHNPMQMQLLQIALKVPLVVNQMQLSITHSGMISSGIVVNTNDPSAPSRDGGILDYCRLNGTTMQAWSPFQAGIVKEPFLGNERFPELNAKIEELAQKYGVTTTTIAIAWILRHPAKIQPVVGTMNTQRMKDICKAAEITLTREDWYQIYRAAGNLLP